jgi:hypothetical protein
MNITATAVQAAALKEKDMSTIVTKEPPMERYRLRDAATWAWATIALRDYQRSANDATILHGGEILINSDFGNYAYSWGNMGCPLKQFLCGLDRGYIIDKLANGREYEFDFDGSVVLVKKEIIKQRREHDLDTIDARLAWEEIPTDRCSQDMFIHRLFDCKPLGREPWCFTTTREKPRFTAFHKHVWLPFIEHLRAEISDKVTA